MPLLFLLGIFVILIAATAAYFISPRLSPIPFFPTNKKDLQLIVRTIFQKGPGPSRARPYTVVDLGAGTGTVIFAAASAASLKPNKKGATLARHNGQHQPSRLKLRFVAVEINPLLVLILHLRRLFHPNRDKIKIIHADMFSFDFNRVTRTASRVAIYLYIGPMFMNRLNKQFKNLPKGSRVISYMYEMPMLKHCQKEVIKGYNNIYCYTID